MERGCETLLVATKILSRPFSGFCMVHNTYELICDFSCLQHSTVGMVGARGTPNLPPETPFSVVCYLLEPFVYFVLLVNLL